MMTPAGALQAHPAGLDARCRTAHAAWRAPIAALWFGSALLRAALAGGAAN